MTTIISYEKISPAVLTTRLFLELPCSVSYRDIDEDYFEITVFETSPRVLKKAENILAQYV